MNPRVINMAEASLGIALKAFHNRHAPPPFMAHGVFLPRERARRAIRHAKKFRDYVNQHQQPREG